MLLHLHMEIQVLYTFLSIQTVRYLFFCFNQYLFNSMIYIRLYFTNFDYRIARREWRTIITEGSDLKCVLVSQNKAILDIYKYSFYVFDMVIKPLQVGKLICRFHRIKHCFQCSKVWFLAYYIKQFADYSFVLNIDGSITQQRCIYNLEQNVHTQSCIVKELQRCLFQKNGII